MYATLSLCESVCLCVPYGGNRNMLKATLQPLCSIWYWHGVCRVLSNNQRDRERKICPYFVAPHCAESRVSTFAIPWNYIFMYGKRIQFRSALFQSTDCKLNDIPSTIHYILYPFLSFSLSSLIIITNWWQSKRRKTKRKNLKRRKTPSKCITRTHAVHVNSSNNKIGSDHSEIEILELCDERSLI